MAKLGKIDKSHENAAFLHDILCDNREVPAFNVFARFGTFFILLKKNGGNAQSIMKENVFA